MEGPSDEGRASLAANVPHAGGAAAGTAAHSLGTPAALNPPAPQPAIVIRPTGPAAHAPPRHRRRNRAHPVYAALDLGTTSCRLLLARPTRRGFEVIDGGAFSRIIRLGEGVSATGELARPAVARAMQALRVCAKMIAQSGAVRSRCVATEACRAARNGPEFVDRVRREIGLDMEVLSREAEARLAVSGCASLIEDDADLALVFDIGGGSSELIWLDLKLRSTSWRRSFADRLDAQNCIRAWTSLPVGFVTLTERFGGREVSEETFETMVAHVVSLIQPFEAQHKFAPQLASGRGHLLGTSGTVTTIAGVLLGLSRYDRKRVDGSTIAAADVRKVAYDLLRRSYAERAAEPCIGAERAEMVLSGCAILEALLRVWPAERLIVADRGLREGMLVTMMAADGHLNRRAQPAHAGNGASP